MELVEGDASKELSASHLGVLPELREKRRKEVEAWIARCDAEAEKRKFAEVLNLEKMQGEGLKHVDVMQARVVTLDADDDLIALLEGVQVDLKDEIDMTQFKGATDKLVEALSDVSQNSTGEWSEDEEGWEPQSAAKLANSDGVGPWSWSIAGTSRFASSIDVPKAMSCGDGTFARFHSLNVELTLRMRPPPIGGGAATAVAAAAA